MSSSGFNVTKIPILIPKRSPFAKLNEGIKRRIHSMIIAMSFKLLVPLVAVIDASINLRIRTTNDPANPMKKLKTITNMLLALGDLKKNVVLYTNDLKC